MTDRVRVSIVTPFLNPGRFLLEVVGTRRFRVLGWLGEEPGQTQRLNKDNYELFTAGGIDFLVVHLEIDMPTYAVQWADEIIHRYPDRQVILSTHAFLNTSNARPTSRVTTRSDGMSAAQVWDQLVYPNCNVFMVVNGHYPGEGRLTSTNSCGKPVHQIVTDYQSRTNGGDGWLRYYTFKPSKNTIEAKTYSPKLGTFEVDASSEFMSRPHPVGDCALVYGGAQKNLGPSGLVLAIVRKDLYPKQKKTPAKLWSFKDLAESKSMINTPPTFGIYILLEVFRWLEGQGGLAAMEQINATKAKAIYDAIDNSNGFYKGTVSNKEQRSHMNVTYTLPSEELTDEFVKTAAKQGMVGLKGYRTVGGIRASIYNAMPVEGAAALASFMRDFASKKS